MPTIGAATNTANVVTNQRKTKCCIQRSYRDFWFHQMRARNCLRSVRCSINGLKSSTPINLCQKRTKLSKVKIKRHRKPADRLPERKSEKPRRRAVDRQPEKPSVPLLRKLQLREQEKCQCLLRQELWRGR